MAQTASEIQRSGCAVSRRCERCSRRSRSCRCAGRASSAGAGSRSPTPLGVSKQAVHESTARASAGRDGGCDEVGPAQPPEPRAKTIGPAEAYLAAGAAEARRLGHSYIGTEHILSVLTRNPMAALRRLLADSRRERGGRAGARLLVAGRVAEPRRSTRKRWHAGIDLDSVRERLDERFGPGALERTRAAARHLPAPEAGVGVRARPAGDRPLGDEHVLLGMLSVPDSVAARIAPSLGVSAEDVQAILAPRTSVAILPPVILLPPTRPLSDGAIVVRLPGEQDVDALVRYGDDPDVAKTIWFPIPTPCSRAQAAARLDDFKRGWQEKSRFGPALIIAAAETDEMIGVLSCACASTTGRVDLRRSFAAAAIVASRQPRSHS